MKEKIYILFLFVLSLLPCNLLAQQKTISGLVTDGQGNPVVGVTVTAIGETTQTTNTDDLGRYRVLTTPSAKLTFAFVGYVTEEHVLKDEETTVNIRLTESAEDIDEVVVIGFGQQKKESVVASISTVTAKELAVTGRGLSNSIAGQLPGIVAIQPSGEPGYDDSNFWIRGVSSFMGGTNPLIIIDGIPRSQSDMNNIPVEDIESFSVLKDAAATAVYGAEGANGVVLVTTKRGTPQKTTISLDARHSVRTPLRLPTSLDAYRTLSLYNEATWNEDGNPTTGWLPTYDDITLEKYLTGADPDLYPNTDWLTLLKPNTNVSRYTINFRGGGDRMRFFTSGAYYTEDGLYNSNTVEDYNANLKYERFNLRSNIDMDLTSTTKLSVDLSGFFVKQNAPIQTADQLWSIISLAPRYLFPMMYSDGSFSEHPVYSAGSVGTAERANPYNLLNNMGYSRNQEVTLQSKIHLTQQLDYFTPGLSWRGIVGFDNLSQGRTNRTKEAISYFADSRDAEGNLVLRQIRGGAALSNPSAAGSSGERNIYLETALDYKRTFDKHDVTGMVLYNQKERQYQNRNNGIEMLPYRKQSMVARGTYGYDGKYLLEASMGMTGSENFAAGYRWGVFPSVGVAWWLSREDFWEPLEQTVNKLKFRASYGKTGNDVLANDLSRFPYREQLNESSSGYNFAWTGGAGVSNNGQGSGSPGAGIVEMDYATPLLKWEEENKFNAGIDVGLFNNRIDATVDFFFNERYDILMRRNTLPTAAGLRVSPMQNFGRTQNRGFDMNVTGTQRINELTLSGRLNYTFTRNKILEYDEVPQPFHYQAYTGQSIGQPFIYLAEGLYTPDDFLITQNPSTGAQNYQLRPELPDPGFAVAPGDIRYADLNGDGQIDNYDQTYTHGFFSNITPGIVYGFGLAAEWRGFSAGLFFQGAGQFSTNLLGKTENFYPFQRSITDAALRDEAMNRWTATDPYNQDVLFPRLRTANNGNNTRTSTWWYRDASYIRLKNIEFGYTFKSDWVERMHLSSIRLYAQGENLHTWDKVKFWDPEVTARSGARYPISSTWTFGLNVTF
ncbi:TonB-dependent receptor [Sphingobacterium corticibacterium]|uniref:TonB-dependent receptor n=2 Tax=Sphingobacterium corticibacterium TaxID=2484746 RepID=A0A4Q6XQQ3_9SPHI|nr:TonB-dependent receptor [Sphingobacterium corticibacterium]